MSGTSPMHPLRRACTEGVVRIRAANRWRPVMWAAVVALGVASHAARSDTTLPKLISRAKPAVVLVGSYGLMDTPRFGFRGTGFAVGDGRQIVTNVHVLPQQEPGRIDQSVAIQAWTADAGWVLRGARVEKKDYLHDLALLQVDDGEPLPTLPLARHDASEGDAIALIGFPIGGALGYSHVTHHGIVSAWTAIVPPASGPQGLSERAVRQLRQGSFKVLQLDATAYPGNSGGPVINIATGEVVGVINMVVVKAAHESALSAPTGISYAIPASHVLDLLSGGTGAAGR